MLRLENWGDLFKYNKELLEDDFNPGQSLVVKSKTRSIDGTSVKLIINLLKKRLQELGVTYKQGVPDSNNDAKIALETKFKSVIGGNVHEGTIKQDGSLIYDLKCDCLAVIILLQCLILYLYRKFLMLKDSPLS